MMRIDIEEKKLTDEDIVKAWEFCLNKDTNCETCPYDKTDYCAITTEEIIALIHCLQDEKAELHEKRMDAEYAIDKWMEENTKLKAEIERLKEERETANKHDLMYWFNAYRECTEDCEKYVIEASDTKAENIRLQKQVDELKDKLGKVLSGIKMDELLVAKGIEQAVKDTAKEICEMIDGTCISSKGYLCSIISKRYGVEVE